jgi:hypothetical protein
VEQQGGSVGDRSGAIVTRESQTDLGWPCASS